LAFPKCGYCKNFHTTKCVAESKDSVKEKAFYQDEDDEPFDDTCFEFDMERVKEKGDLVEFFTELVMEEFTIKHFVKGNSSLGLHVWEDGRYVEGEEKLKAHVESLGLKAGLKDKVKTHVVNEVLEKIKRRTYYEFKEEPLRIAFKNYALDWKEFLAGNLEKALTPIEETKENPVFHLIPYNLNVEALKCALEGFSVGNGIQEVAEGYAPEIVAVFKSWVGETWVLLFEIIGYCLYPEYHFNKAFMLVGDGSNGKSTFLRLVREILGEGNVTGQSLQDLCLYRFAQAELYHKLANIHQDIPSKPISYAGWFKILTGEDSASAPRKFKSSLYFKNYAKLLFSANELPEVSDMTEAFWRRWIVIEFPNKFQDNPNFFEETFTREAVDKIIVLSVLAFTNVWLNRGFSIKGTSQDFKELWLRKVNSIYAYLKSGIEEGRLTLDNEDSTPCNALYEDYRAWCEDEDIEAKAKAIFTKELERLFGIIKKRVREDESLPYVYVGIKLNEGKGYEPCEVCGRKATTSIVREDGEHWLCGKCATEWEGNL
jgi:putative DNA primase/helicase